MRMRILENNECLLMLKSVFVNKIKKTDKLNQNLMRI